MTITITVAAIEWPKDGKKQGALIDSTGKRWGVWANKMHLYQQFSSYEITYNSSEFKGKTYFTIDTAKLVGANSQPQSASQIPAVPQKSIVPSYGSMPPSDDIRRMDIFVCGAFNNSMANPNCSPLVMNSDNMIILIENLKKAWKATLGPKPDPISTSPSRDNDMNDEIPF